jgi:PAS domain S-box-containing protein
MASASHPGLSKRTSTASDPIRLGQVEGARLSSREDRSHTPADFTYLAWAAELDAENRKLREENARLKLILESAVDYAIITMDVHGCITSWNAGACHIFGYTEAEVVGRSGDLVFTSEDRAEGKFTVELCRAVETGRAVNERWHLRRDGTRLWASGPMMPLLGAEGQPEGFLNILRDRTEGGRRRTFNS